MFLSLVVVVPSRTQAQIDASVAAGRARIRGTPEWKAAQTDLAA